MTERSIGEASAAVVNKVAAKTGRVKQFPDKGPNEFVLRREMEATKTLIGGLRDMGVGDDADLVADSIEGETSLHEAVDWALSQIDENEVLIIGLKAKEGTFADRRRRMEEQSERLRALIEQALVVADSETLRLPTATLSLRKSKPSLIVDSEAEVPSEFFTAAPVPPPALDKAALRLALEVGRLVPGARLSNGNLALTVRRK